MPKKVAIKKTVKASTARGTTRKVAKAKSAAPKKTVAKKTTKKKPVTAKTAEKKVAAKEAVPAKKAAAAKKAPPVEQEAPEPRKPVKLTVFVKQQQKRLLDLRDSLMDAMAGVAQDNLRTRAEGSEASAFGMHQADAGSDAYDRDFALNLLSQEQDALYEIQEALKRVDEGTYGICETSGQQIAKARLEAIPFARFTVECQAQIEKERTNGYKRHSVRSLFGLSDDGEGDGDSDMTTAEALEKDEK